MRSRSLQGFAWHIEYVPVWKRGDFYKPKSKPKQTAKSTKHKFEKHEWTDWSQFGKYQHKELA